MNTADKTYRYLYKTEKPRGFTFFGILLLLGVFPLLEYPLFIPIPLIAGFLVIISQTGIELNFENKNYRLINSFGTISFGKWKTLPKLKCVSVFKVRMAKTTNGWMGGIVTEHDEVFQVSLVTEQNKRLKLLQSKDVNEALEFAQTIGKRMELNVWDASNGEGKWLT